MEICWEEKQEFRGHRFPIPRPHEVNPVQNDMHRMAKYMCSVIRKIFFLFIVLYWLLQWHESILYISHMILY